MLTKANTAKEQTEIASEKEIVELSAVGALAKDNGGEIKRNHLNDELTNNIGIEGTDYTLSESEIAPFIITYLGSGRSYLIDGNGNISEYVDIAKYVEIGDYVAYNPTVSNKNGTQQVDSNKLTYTSPTGSATEHGNGYTSTETNTVEGEEKKGGQKFTATDSTKWRVLDIGMGTVTLISAEPIKKDETTQDSGDFVMQGAIGYLYAERELNEICKIFGYGYGANTSQVTNYSYGGPKDGELTGKITGSGARSITIEDINKKAGITEADYTTLNSSYGSIAYPASNVYYPTVNNDSATEKSNSEEVEKFKNTYYYYSKSHIGNTNVQGMLFNGNYWLASRCIVTDSDYASFRVRYAVGDGAYASNLCYGNSSRLNEGTLSAYAVRPVVTLKSDVIDISANYDSENGWKLK